MDMLPSEYIKVSYFWPKSAKKSFCLWRVSKKRKKIEKNFEKNLKFFFIKSILIIIYELCQNLGYLRSLWRAPETKTLGGCTQSPSPGQSKIKPTTNKKQISKTKHISVKTNVQCFRIYTKQTNSQGYTAFLKTCT